MAHPESEGEGSMRTVVVVPGGEGATAAVDPWKVVAADGGADRARALGWVPDVIVGDLDSVTPEGVEGVADIRRHPVDKDASDLALAMDVAASLGGDEIVVVGGFGGRLDHLLVNAAVLAAPRALPVRWVGEGVRVDVVRGERTVPLSPGETFSLLAWGGTARVTLRGARWELEEAELSPTSSLGLSNVAEGPVSLGVDGVVLVIVSGP
jgi:thiamine pyrophosphokinase